MEEKKKSHTNFSSSFFVSQDSGKELSPWEALEEAIESKDKTKAIACFEAIAAIVSEINATGSQYPKTSLLKAVPVLEKALEDFEKIWYSSVKSDEDEEKKHKQPPRNLTEQEKFSYWIIRALLHTLEQYVELIPEDIISRIPCLPIETSFLEEEIYALFDMQKEILSDGMDHTQDAKPAKYFKGSIGPGKPAVICHPLYDALLFKAEKTSQTLMRRTPQTEKEMMWSPPKIYEGYLINQNILSIFDPKRHKDDPETIGFWNLLVLSMIKENSIIPGILTLPFIKQNLQQIIQVAKNAQLELNEDDLRKYNKDGSKCLLM
ncbi:MAG TPA: hypothetical protein VHE99_11000 [Gammaproteobacteria bacterium]|nr:hypothetical protein [Gammaproteobacteria bacterium]